MEEAKDNPDNEFQSKASDALQQIFSQPAILKSIVDSLLPSYGKNKIILDEVLSMLRIT